MTTSDPAVEAAFRAWNGRYPFTVVTARRQFEESLMENGVAAAMVMAAREALNPTTEDEDDYPVGSVQG